MYSLNQKLILFATICVPIRLIIASLPSKLTKKNVSYFALFLLLIGLGFIFKARSASNSTAFGSKPYWSGMNHGFMYMLASILMRVNPVYASIVLYADVIYGIATVFNHYG